MKPVKIKNMLHPCGQPALLIAADTSIPRTESMETVLKTSKHMLTSMGYGMLPPEIQPADALYASRHRHKLDETPGVYDRAARTAHEYLKTLDDKNIIVEINEVFATPATWYIAFWCIPGNEDLWDFEFRPSR